MHVISIWYLCDVHVISMWCLCDMHVISMWCLCDVHVISMWCLWNLIYVHNVCTWVYMCTCRHHLVLPSRPLFIWIWLQIVPFFMQATMVLTYNGDFYRYSISHSLCVFWLLAWQQGSQYALLRYSGSTPGGQVINATLEPVTGQWSPGLIGCRLSNGPQALLGVNTIAYGE